MGDVKFPTGQAVKFWWNGSEMEGRVSGALRGYTLVFDQERRTLAVRSTQVWLPGEEPPQPVEASAAQEWPHPHGYTRVDTEEITAT